MSSINSCRINKWINACLKWLEISIVWTTYFSSMLEQWKILPLGVDKYTLEEQGLGFLDSDTDVKFSCKIQALQLFT